MLPRFLLSRGGPPVLQLQRLLVAAPLRPPDMGIRSARILGGNSAIGRLSISPVTVRYVSSDAKDSKKSKKPRKKEDKDKGKKGLRAKKGEEKYRKERGEEEEGEEGEEEGAMREVNVEGKAVRDTVGGDRKAPVGRAAVIAAATGVSAPEVETPKKESAPVAAQEVVATKAEVPPAPTVAGPMAGPAAETTPEAPVPEDQAPPAAEGLEAIAADPSTPGEASTASSTAAELGPSSTFGEAIEITSNSPTEPALKHLQQEAMLGEEPLKRESKSSEPEESKVEQESSVVDDANPPTPASKVEQESAMRSQEAVGKTGVPEAQPYTGPLDFYKRA
ncbi:hypothetical protein EV426DRAFT_374763 [Tirmania nivea]|nr:hypothetical protein EV426DRAFT_374763 [Tirmania nivea]